MTRTELATAIDKLLVSVPTSSKLDARLWVVDAVEIFRYVKVYEVLRAERQSDEARMEAFAKTPECIEAAMTDAGRWYFLTRYVDRIARNFAGWVCYYRREPNDVVIWSAASESIQKAVQGAMDDVERFAKMELAPINADDGRPGLSPGGGKGDDVPDAALTQRKEPALGASSRIAGELREPCGEPESAPYPVSLTHELWIHVRALRERNQYRAADAIQSAIKALDNASRRCDRQ